MLSRSLALACVFTVLPIATFAQDRAVSAQPYVFIAPGAVNAGGTTLHTGGGLDVVHRSGIGGGAEFGYVGPFPDGFDYGIGLLSYSASYRWLSDDRVVPFVNGGMSTVTIRGRGNAWHAGGGLEYWLREGFGLRLELRDHIPPDGGGHLWGARIGFTWSPGGRITG